MDKNQELRDADSFATWALWVFCLVVPLWLAMGWLAFNIKSVIGVFSKRAAESIEPGTFGDMFGAANALFSALAFAVIVITLWLQIKELKEARLDRKANLEHQEVIAKSQESAAAMQLKVARSGDVYVAYARVAGSEFVDRIQRLRWLCDASRTVPFDGHPLTLDRLFKFRNLMHVLSKIQDMSPPAHYQAARSKGGGNSFQLGTHKDLAIQVLDDVQQCVHGILDLRAAIALDLLDARTIRLVLTPDDCRMIAAGAKASGREDTQVASFLEEIANMIASDAGT